MFIKTKGGDFMTIRDLLDQVNIEGAVQIKETQDDDIVVVYETDDIRFEDNRKIKRYLNREITYMYVNSIPTLCIEIK